MSQGFKNDLHQAIMSYRGDPLSGDKVHVIARVNGTVKINDYVKVFASIETNYNRIAFIWGEDGIVPAEYQEHYPNELNRYPVLFTYFKDKDILHLEGKYFGENYKLVVQLPPKRP
ncbi:hypothetical protein [Paenibacillus sp. FSL R10-2748]|uniref:hypothetical protein n=1 Tax=Paenibacillus sp. FSL R10-2748 TaxID=2954658 RepID=UPI0030FB27BB